MEMEDKENDTKQQEKEKASKLLADQGSQKPRRSVLKEFDPFAPESPCPMKPNPGNIPLIDEEEIYEDAETSLTSFLCPKNKSFKNSANESVTPTKRSDCPKSLLILPDIPAIRPNLMANETADFDYVEAVEGFTPAKSIPIEKSSSDEDIEFGNKYKAKNVQPKSMIENIDNKLLDTSANTNIFTNGLSIGEITDTAVKESIVPSTNIMVDSLDVIYEPESNQHNTTTNSVLKEIMEKSTETHESHSDLGQGVLEDGPLLEITEKVGNKKHSIHETDSMIDSLELSKPQELVENLNTTFDKQAMHLEGECAQKCDTGLENHGLVDSLEVQKTEEEELKEYLVMEEALNSSCKDINRLANGKETECLNATFEMQSSGNTNQVQVSILCQKTEIKKEQISQENIKPEATQNISDNVPIENCNNSLIEGNKTIEETSKMDEHGSIVIEESRDQIKSKEHEGPEAIKNSNFINVTPEGSRSANEGNKTVVEDEFTEENKNITIEDTIETKSKDIDVSGVIVNQNSTNVITTENASKEEENKTIVIEDTSEDTKVPHVLENLSSTNRISSEDSHEPMTAVIKDASKKEEYYDVGIEDILDKAKSKDQASSEPETLEQENATSIKHGKSILHEDDVKNKSVSLKDILGLTEPVFTNSANCSKTKEILGNTNNVDMHISPEQTVVITTEEELESNKVMASLAESLNQTIDIEEPAFSEDIHSSQSNTSGESSKESLNVTIEHSVGEDKSEEHVSKVRDIINQKVDYVDNGSDNIVKEVDSNATDVQSSVESNYIQQETHSCVLEIRPPKVESMSTEPPAGSHQEEHQKVVIKRNIVEENKLVSGKKGIELKDIENAEGDIIYPTVSIGDNKCKAEESMDSKSETVNFTNAQSNQNEDEKIDVKNIVKENKVVSGTNGIEPKELETKHGCIEKPTNIIDDNKCKTERDLHQMEIISNTTIESVPKTIICSSSKQNEIDFKEGLKISESKIDVQDDSHPTNNSQTINKLPVDEKILNDYTKERTELKSQLSNLEEKIQAIKMENRHKDQLLLRSQLEKQTQESIGKKMRRVLEQYECQIVKQNQDLESLKEMNDTTTRHFTNLELAFSDVFENYKKAKIVIEEFRKNEEILLQNFEKTQNALRETTAKYNSLKEFCEEKVSAARNEIDQTKEKNELENAKLRAMVKRLEIKCSSLEIALKQKSEECQALSALCEDITGKPL